MLLGRFLLDSLVRYRIVLDSDSEQFGGHQRLDHDVEFYTYPEAWDNRENHMMVTLSFILVLHEFPSFFCTFLFLPHHMY